LEEEEEVRRLGHLASKEVTLEEAEERNEGAGRRPIVCFFGRKGNKFFCSFEKKNIAKRIETFSFL